MDQRVRPRIGLEDGRDGFLPPLTADLGRALLHIGDVLVGVLLNAKEGIEPNLRTTREPYEAFLSKHELIDRAVAVLAADEEDSEAGGISLTLLGPQERSWLLRLQPSEILYALDRDIYVDVLSSLPETVTETEPAEPETAVTEVYEGPHYAEPLPQLLRPDLSNPSERVNALMRFLQDTGKLSAAGPDTRAISESLLATAESNLGVDWEERPRLVSLLTVAVRRALVQLGMERDRADDLSRAFVDWYRDYSPDSNDDTT